MMKKWCAVILWWRGDLPKPRKNMKVTRRVVKAKTLQELINKLKTKRFKAYESITHGDSPVSGGGLYELILKEKVTEAKQEKKEHSI